MEAAKIDKARLVKCALAAIALWLGSVATMAQAASSVVTQMYDNGHSGWNRTETTLTVANVSRASNFCSRTRPTARPDSQPLYVRGLKIGPKGAKQAHNVIFVATENNTVYALTPTPRARRYGRRA